MNNQEDKAVRKHKRFPFRKDIMIDGAKLCSSMDISEGGLYISAMQYFEENSIIYITISLKDEELTVKAQVRYCQQGMGVGIMFIDLNDEQRAKIKKLIEGITEAPP
jgi:Tfp pilus assembly protein PilZ